MAVLKVIKRNHRSESLRGRFMVDTVRGTLRVRKWPKKRGTPKSALQLWWIDWFRQANKLAKYVDAATARRAIELTAGTGMYPRDIILKAMRGRLYSWVDQNGKRWHPMAGVQDISDSLDVLAQDIGSLLVRWADRWRPVDLGDPGDVLTSGGPGVVPDFQPAAGGGGFQGGAMVGMVANQSIANAAVVPVIYGTEDYDTAGIHDNSINPSRLTVPVGTTWVRLSANTRWASNNTGVRLDFFHKNGAAFNGQSMHYKVGLGTSEEAIVSPVLAVIAGDYFEHVVYQSTGGNLNVLGPDVQANFSMELL